MIKLGAEPYLIGGGTVTAKVNAVWGGFASVNAVLAHNMESRGHSCKLLRFALFSEHVHACVCVCARVCVHVCVCVYCVCMCMYTYVVIWYPLLWTILCMYVHAYVCGYMVPSIVDTWGPVKCLGVQRAFM